jgi:hypothetical protein
MAADTRQAPASRLVFVGRSSKLWARLIPHFEGRRHAVAIGHSDVGGFAFDANDDVWIGSYAPNEAGNLYLLSALAHRGVTQATYISTATANIADTNFCYHYPRIKARAEAAARTILKARIVRIGLIYDHVRELPGGTSAATNIRVLANAMQGGDLAPAKDDIIHQYSMVSRPIETILESKMQRLYGKMIRLTGRFPCVLRPIDLILSLIGWHWYGYLYLSNHKCMSTI